MFYNYDCRWFTGYKPCKHKRACLDCPHFDRVETKILIISLEAMGAVLRSTCLLPPIKRKFPRSKIVWLTKKVSRGLLLQNPYIDQIMVLDETTSACLAAMQFDVVYSVDKSLEAGALAFSARAKEKYGFGINETGVIVPLTPHADYLYQVGLDDELKFYKNQQTETQMITEAMALPWQRDPYVLDFSQQERDQIEAFRAQWHDRPGRLLFGFNTGCSLLYPYKKFTVQRSVEILKQLRKELPDMRIVLLGGPEDTERHQEIMDVIKEDPHVINSPTDQGIRTGLCAMAATDIVLSGCSLGLHMAIGLKKPTVAWFGVSCSQEIDLYEKGVKLEAEVSCSPCWRKACNNEPKCYDMVSPQRILQATRDLIARFQLP